MMPAAAGKFRSSKAVHFHASVRRSRADTSSLRAGDPRTVRERRETASDAN
jgi:hypothetical protein